MKEKKNIIYRIIESLSIVIILTSLSLLFYCFLNIEKFSFSKLAIIFYILLPLTISFILFYLVKKKKFELQIFFISTILFSYLASILLSLLLLLGFWGRTDQELKNYKTVEFYKKILLKERKKKIDERTKFEFLIDERTKNKEIYSYIPVDNSYFEYLDKEFPKIRWLGTISNSHIVYCMKYGEWLSYKSDKYGFNNLNSDWNKEIDLAVLGDSYVHSQCQETENDIVRKISKKLGVNALNFGLSNIGLIHYLAITVEYLKIVKPKNTLIILFEGNDFHFVTELDDIFNQYLEDKNFSQNLITRQDEINSIYKYAHQKEIIEKTEKIIKNKYIPDRIRKKTITNLRNIYHDLILIRPIREKINLSFSKKNIQKKQTDTFEESFEKKIRTTKEILSKIKEQVDTWEGNLYIAYIPWPKIDNGAYLDSNAYDAKQFSSNSSLSFLYNFRQVFPEIVDDLNIKFINTIPAFEKHENPKILIEYRSMHLSDEGYKLLSNIIVKELKNLQ